MRDLPCNRSGFTLESGAHLQVAGVLVPGTLRGPQLRGEFKALGRLVGVAEPEGTVVVEVVADEHVGAGRLR